MKIQNYFIWEKSYFHNNGIKLKFSLSPYCYIKPTMSTTWNELKQEPHQYNPFNQYYYCINKIYFWLWFRLSINIEFKKDTKLL